MEQEIEFDAFIDKCLEKWSDGEVDDRRLEFFKEHFNSWINQLPAEYHEDILVLLDNFLYFTRKNVNKYLEGLHNKLESDRNYKVSQKNTAHAFIISKDGKSNSSNDYWHNYKLINNLNGNCYADLKSEEIKWNKINNVVFIDDFSGSGQSFLEELEKHKEKLKDKTVVFLTVCIMENAIKNIKAYGNTNKINIDIFSVKSQDKAFECDYFDCNESSKNKILKMSCKIGLINKEDDTFLGWNDSQSLVSFYNNTPNNTLKFIRQDSEKYFSLFPRGRQVSNLRPKVSTLKKGKENRKKENYKNMVSKR